MKIPRPKVLGGITVKVMTGCGALYVQMNWYNGKLFEVFATMGRTGGCAIAHTEALTRTITLGLRQHDSVPIAEYIRQLQEIGCPTPLSFPKEDAVKSCPDALAKVLREYGSLSVAEVIGLVRGEEKKVASEEEAAEEELGRLAVERRKQEL